MTYSVAVAGSTSRTLLCAQALDQDERFKINLLITPKAKPIGRNQTVEPNVLEQWGKQKSINTILLDDKINIKDFEQLNTKEFAFLLVVDFGYLVPEWLLSWPRVAPVNVHPSALPRWRGSAPAQFVLLNGETESAISLIKMDNQLDHGPIISQYPFSVEPHWTQTEYYQTSFSLMTAKLAQDLASLATNKIDPEDQPHLSPTPIAKKLTKKDSFVPWEKIHAALNQITTSNSSAISQQLERATRAYLPWPGLWTIIITQKGKKRMKILKTHLKNHQLVLDEVQIEGQNPALFNQVKNILQ